MRVLLVFLVCSLFSHTQAQQTEEQQVRLNELRQKFNKEEEIQLWKVKEYAEKNNLPLRYFDALGNLVVLVSIDEANTPRYVAVDNANAAATTGVVKLRNGGELGLNLEGEDLIIGVWDGGNINEHVEFDQRIIQTQGSSLSDHATHVTGTIIASGINSAAKGMAPKARVTSWDFNNDLSEMASLARSDQTTLLLSNHSYGTITGWRFEGSWSWFGNATISNQEDYRFGFYSSTSKAWDALAFNAPYYTICKSAGNDRSDAGNGNFPPDCDGGSGFDCIGDVGSAKNIITVGAVSRVTNYVNEGSVVMSSFSSWGPTDDGRIKPDFVGDGVGVFSSFSATPTSYGTLSGTSMATPNVTGSLALLQELYKKTNDSFLRASTLKALAIHTVKEAGVSSGPDYKFGWGLLDVEAAARVILLEDNANIVITDEILQNDQVYEVELTPIANTKITATIVWADPAGNPVSPALDPTDLMLVNDLDIRIVDSGTGVQYPWILNPQEPNQQAGKGDNFRDNVEKIEFNNPQDRPYKLIVSHKGQLQGGEQAFSLILTYTSTNDPSLAYYWIGGSGSWNNPAHWSLTSGGTSAGITPTGDDRVFFDENSFSASSNTVNLTEDAVCASLVWFADELVTLSLNDNTLSINGNLNITSSNVNSTGSGKIYFTGTKNENNRISFSNNQFSNVQFEFDGESSWVMTGLKSAEELILNTGKLEILDQEVTLKKLTVASSETQQVLDLSGTKLNGMQYTAIEQGNLTFNTQDAEINFQASVNGQINWSNVNFDGIIRSPANSNVELVGNSNEIATIQIGGVFNVLGDDNYFLNTSLSATADLGIASSSTLQLSSNTVISSSQTQPVKIRSIGTENASLTFTGYYKLCFDYLEVSNVDVQGDAKVNAGLHSEVENAQNWLEQSCEEILFADFSFLFNCVSSLTEFRDESTGNITSWSWNFGDASSEENSSMDENPSHVYATEGVYTVSLTVSDGNTTETFQKEIVITANDLPENRIVLSGGKLYSFITASSYQWYRDGEPIDGAVTRDYAFNNEEGVYFVVTRNTGCNRTSEIYSNIITGSEPDIWERSINVYPNPTNDIILISVPSKVKGYKVILYDLLGNRIDSKEFANAEESMSIGQLSSGVYLMHILVDKVRIVKKIIRQ